MTRLILSGFVASLTLVVLSTLPAHASRLDLVIAIDTNLSISATDFGLQTDAINAFMGDHLDLSLPGFNPINRITRVAIVRFGGEAPDTNVRIALDDPGLPRNANDALSDLQGIVQSTPRALFPGIDHETPLEGAVAELNFKERANTKKAILFITNGLPTPPSGDPFADPQAFLDDYRDDITGSTLDDSIIAMSVAVGSAIAREDVIPYSIINDYAFHAASFDGLGGELAKVGQVVDAILSDQALPKFVPEPDALSLVACAGLILVTSRRRSWRTKTA